MPKFALERSSRTSVEWAAVLRAAMMAKGPQIALALAGFDADAADLSQRRGSLRVAIGDDRIAAGMPLRFDWIAAERTDDIGHRFGRGGISGEHHPIALFFAISGDSQNARLAGAKAHLLTPWRRR